MFSYDIINIQLVFGIEIDANLIFSISQLANIFFSSMHFISLNGG